MWSGCFLAWHAGDALSKTPVRQPAGTVRAVAADALTRQRLRVHWLRVTDDRAGDEEEHNRPSRVSGFLVAVIIIIPTKQHSKKEQSKGQSMWLVGLVSGKGENSHWNSRKSAGPEFAGLAVKG